MLGTTLTTIKYARQRNTTNHLEQLKEARRWTISHSV